MVVHWVVQMVDWMAFDLACYLAAKLAVTKVVLKGSLLVAGLVVMTVVLMAASLA